MLLLYTGLLGRVRTHYEAIARPQQWTFAKFQTDLEQEGSQRLRHTKPIEEIRHIKQVYHLERRLFW